MAGIRTAVGDVRDTGLPGACVDAVLLLGPLYHLLDRAERVDALRECARIVRPGGPVFAAAVSRWAPRIDGMLRERPYLEYPAALDLISDVDRTGMLPPLYDGAFTAFLHRPEELREEMTEAGLPVADLVSVEGPAFILDDLDARMADPVDRSVALEVARAIERVPELIGFGPHLIATGIRSLPRDNSVSVVAAGDPSWQAGSRHSFRWAGLLPRVPGLSGPWRYAPFEFGC